MGKAILAMDIASLMTRERSVWFGVWVSCRRSFCGLHVGLLGINNGVNMLGSWSLMETRKGKS